MVVIRSFNTPRYCWLFFPICVVTTLLAVVNVDLTRSRLHLSGLLTPRMVVTHTVGPTTFCLFFVRRRCCRTRTFFPVLRWVPICRVVNVGRCALPTTRGLPPPRLANPGPTLPHCRLRYDYPRVATRWLTYFIPICSAGIWRTIAPDADYACCCRRLIGITLPTPATTLPRLPTAVYLRNSPPPPTRLRHLRYPALLHFPGVDYLALVILTLFLVLYVVDVAIV